MQRALLLSYWEANFLNPIPTERSEVEERDWIRSQIDQSLGITS